MATQGPLGTGNPSNNTGVGSIAWGSTGNLYSSDNFYAIAAAVTPGAITNYLWLDTFGFTIPSGATIDGITVAIERYFIDNGVGGDALDNIVRLVKGGTIQGNNKANEATGSWPTADTSVDYGGPTNLWGLTWTVSDINASNFGVVLSATVSTGDTGCDLRVDYITITINYTAAAVRFLQQRRSNQAVHQASSW